MKADLRLGPLLLISGTLSIRTRWRYVPLWVGPICGRRWWQVQGLIFGAFRWSWYVGLVRA